MKLRPATETLRCTPAPGYELNTLAPRGGRGHPVFRQKSRGELKEKNTLIYLVMCKFFGVHVGAGLNVLGHRGGCIVYPRLTIAGGEIGSMTQRVSERAEVRRSTRETAAACDSQYVAVRALLRSVARSRVRAGHGIIACGRRHRRR